MHWRRNKKWNYGVYSLETCSCSIANTYKNLVAPVLSHHNPAPFIPFHFSFLCVFLPLSFQCHNEFICNSPNKVLSAWTWSKLGPCNANKVLLQIDCVFMNIKTVHRTVFKQSKNFIHISHIRMWLCLNPRKKNRWCFDVHLIFSRDFWWRKKCLAIFEVSSTKQMLISH